MTDICGVVADIKREAQGVYVFPCLTLLGYDNHEAPIQKLQKLGYRLADSNTRSEGREIKNISPFHLFRVMAKEFNYSPVKVVTTEAPGDRTCLMWTLRVPDDKKGEEAIGIVSDVKRESEGEYVIPTSTVFGLNDQEILSLKKDGLTVKDSNSRMEGNEIHGASAFKVMRILCSKYGWDTTGEAVTTTVSGGKNSVMWTLTRKCK